MHGPNDMAGSAAVTVELQNASGHIIECVAFIFAVLKLTPKGPDQCKVYKGLVSSAMVPPM